MEKLYLKNLVAAGVLGVALIISTIYASQTFYQVKSLDNALSVTGSAKQQITSDSVKWISSFTRTVAIDQLKGGYDQMRSDQALVTKFYKDNGFAESDLLISPVTLEQPFKYDANAPKQYQLTQTVQLQSTDLKKVTELAKNTKSLIDAGVIFANQSLEYYYSKLPELRISMLSQAIADAKTRAEKLAESSGKKVGTLKSASMGVVQVTPVNSVDVADYGSYDTSTIDKEVMVTVKALFTLK
ncbi:MAG: SIMPL domain-containing protein [Candidatus Buchananbacteria bacterium]